MATKTPVSTLQELMTKLGNAPPNYVLTHNGCGTHAATFEYRVSAGGVTAVGSGRSKKEAKHEAARNALELLTPSGSSDTQLPSVQPPENVEVVTPYKDQLRENVVGALFDMCITNDIPLPRYELVEEFGPPHEKTFTFSCFVSKQKELGTGRTKKQAKQYAAYHMMNRLKESLGDILVEIQSEMKEDTLENLDKAAAQYVASVDTQKTTQKKKIKLNRQPCSNEDLFADMEDDLLESAWKLLNEKSIPNITEKEDSTSDWMAILKELLEVLNIDQSVEQSRPSKKGEETLFLRLNLPTEAVFFGTGSDFDIALQNASYSAVYYLKVLIEFSRELKTITP